MRMLRACARVRANVAGCKNGKEEIKMEKTYMPDFINADFAVICQTDGLRRFRIQNGDLVYISVAAEIKDGDVVAVQLFGSKAVSQFHRRRHDLERGWWFRSDRHAERPRTW